METLSRPESELFTLIFTVPALWLLLQLEPDPVLTFRVSIEDLSLTDLHQVQPELPNEGVTGGIKA